MASESERGTEEFSAEEITIDELSAGDVEESVGVLARGMRDNPLHIAAFGHNPDRRVRRLKKQFGKIFSVSDIEALLARDGRGTIVGALGMAPPGACIGAMSGGQKLRLLPTLLPMGLGPTRRVLRWTGTWEANDPSDPHWHLGPVAVEQSLQGHGIGTRLMEDFGERMDETGHLAYLETDKEVNVRFYERFGFEVVHETDILDTHNWFMSRPPHSD